MTQEDLKTIKKLIDEGVEKKLREHNLIEEEKPTQTFFYKKEWMKDNWYGD